MKSLVRSGAQIGLDGVGIFRALLFSDFSNRELLLLFAWGECRSTVSLFGFVCFFYVLVPLQLFLPTYITEGEGLSPRSCPFPGSRILVLIS